MPCSASNCRSHDHDKALYRDGGDKVDLLMLASALHREPPDKEHKHGSLTAYPGSSHQTTEKNFDCAESATSNTAELKHGSLGSSRK